MAWLWTCCMWAQMTLFSSILIALSFTWAQDHLCLLSIPLPGGIQEDWSWKTVLSVVFQFGKYRSERKPPSWLFMRQLECKYIYPQLYRKRNRASTKVSECFQGILEVMDREGLDSCLLVLSGGALRLSCLSYPNSPCPEDPCCLGSNICTAFKVRGLCPSFGCDSAIVLQKGPNNGSYQIFQ